MTTNDKQPPRYTMTHGAMCATTNGLGEPAGDWVRWADVEPLLSRSPDSAGALLQRTGTYIYWAKNVSTTGSNGDSDGNRLRDALVLIEDLHNFLFALKDAALNASTPATDASPLVADQALPSLSVPAAVAIPADLVRFLLGEADHRGRWFGEVYAGVSRYWWRTPLRNALDAATASQMTTMEQPRGPARNEAVSGAGPTTGACVKRLAASTPEPTPTLDAILDGRLLADMSKGELVVEIINLLARLRAAERPPTTAGAAESAPAVTEPVAEVVFDKTTKDGNTRYSRPQIFRLMSDDELMLLAPGAKLYTHPAPASDALRVLQEARTAFDTIVGALNAGHADRASMLAFEAGYALDAALAAEAQTLSDERVRLGDEQDPKDSTGQGSGGA